MERRKTGERSLVSRAVDTALIPLHAAVSKQAQKAYLGTALFVTTSLFLLFVASVAYWSFYFNYVPQAGVERPIYLQFGDDSPYGTTSFPSTLTSQQAYDVSLILHLPRTPSNVAAGNFMLHLSLLPPSKSSSPADTKGFFPSRPNASTIILAQSRRPAILTYTSVAVDAANTLSQLPLYVTGWRKESEILKVNMFEGVEFAKGWANVPQSAVVTIEAEEKMQFYEVSILIIARFGGLRWVLYNHRIISFFIFTASFWISSMFSMVLVWLLLSVYQADAKPIVPKKDDELDDTVIKSEPTDSEGFDPTSLEDLSDTSRTFPTLGRQMPLHYAGRKKEEDDLVKREQDEVLGSAVLQPLAGEADDEEDDDLGDISAWRDSGIGTSIDEDRRAKVQRRRKAMLEGRRDDY